MDISHVKQRSEFLPPCEEAIRHSREALLSGEGPVRIRFSKAESGFKGNITVEIREHDDRNFGTDWEQDDPTFFPRRIVAAATALRRCGCYGSYVITHEGGVMEIRQA